MTRSLPQPGTEPSCRRPHRTNRPDDALAAGPGHPAGGVGCFFGLVCRQRPCLLSSGPGGYCNRASRHSGRTSEPCSLIGGGGGGGGLGASPLFFFWLRPAPPEAEVFASRRGHGMGSANRTLVLVDWTAENVELYQRS